LATISSGLWRLMPIAPSPKNGPRTNIRDGSLQGGQTMAKRLRDNQSDIEIGRRANRSWNRDVPSRYRDLIPSIRILSLLLSN
jgi:hypothetical protein